MIYDILQSEVYPAVMFKMHQIRFSPHWTPLGKLTTLPQTS